MEHIQITALANGYFRLLPDEGYLLKRIDTETLHSEAITKTPNEFVAVEA